MKYDKIEIDKNCKICNNSESRKEWKDSRHVIQLRNEEKEKEKEQRKRKK